MTDLTGKVALITGASRGIGEAAAREMAAAGAAVMLAARSEDRIAAIADEIHKAGGRAGSIACDVSNYKDVETAVQSCRNAFGSLDILVNNAGAIEPIGMLVDSDPAAWAASADVNYKGVYHGLRAALPVMLEQGSGLVINISSGAAVSALEGWSHYNSSKAAALSLTRCAENEMPDSIRVVGLSPGTVATQMQREIKTSGINPVADLEWEDHIPPEWPAKAIVWLCSEDATEFRGQDVSLRDDAIRRRIGLIA